jgi:GTP-binding protein
LDDIVKDFPTTEYKDPFEGLPKITIAGRPNVGKSTMTMLYWMLKEIL